MQIQAFPEQMQVLDSRKRFMCAVAGIQGGKTMTGAIWLITEILKNPKDDFLIAAPTYKILEQSTLVKFFQIMPPESYVYKKQDSVLKLKDGGNVFIRSTEIPQNIEGMTLRAAWLDEAGMMKSSIWTYIQARLAIKKGRLLCTSTPYNLGWLYKDIYLVAKERDPDFGAYTWKSIANPWFPKEEYYRAKKRMSPIDFARRYDGEFLKMEGLIYPDWDENKMREDFYDSENLVEVICGIDYGFSNPCAMIVVGIGKDGRCHVLEEVYETRMQVSDQVERAKELYGKYAISCFYVDPTAPALIDALGQPGLPVLPADNDVEVGIQKVRQLIYNDKLRLNFNCYNLSEELGLYHYNPRQADENKPEYKEKPDKIYDHAVDALRYAVATHPLEIFDFFEPEGEDRRTEFWKNVAKKTEKRRIRIERFGNDYADITDNEADLLESLM